MHKMIKKVFSSIFVDKFSSGVQNAPQNFLILWRLNDKQI